MYNVMNTNASTKYIDASRRFVAGTSRAPRSAATFREQMAKTMETARRVEMAERIRELRGPRPQPVIAERAGVSLRTYQNWESGDSVPGWDNLTALANVHGVTEDFILYGEAEGTEPPAVSLPADELQQLREDVSALREDVAEVVDLMRQLLDPLAGLLQAQEDAIRSTDAPASKRGSTKRAQGGRRAVS